MREFEFEKISRAIGDEQKFGGKDSILAGGDSLEILKKIPDSTISLILTDPPYHSTKKKNIVNDTSFDNDSAFISWMEEYAREWLRVLKPNGSVYVFCSPAMSAALEIMFEKYYNILAHIVWTKPNEPGFDGWKQKMRKESLRQWYSHSERVIFMEPACDGNLHRSYFANFLREKRNLAGITAHTLTEMTGAYGKVNHGGAVSNWETGRNIPSREQYQKICEALLATRRVDSMPVYEDVIRPFQMDASKEFTDIWTFPSVRPYSGKHPAEKPLDMLKHAIEASTFPGDIVLDCFGGSGSTAVAAAMINRKSVTIEIDPKWVEKIRDRLMNLPNYQASFEKLDIKGLNSLRTTQQAELFAASMH